LVPRGDITDDSACIPEVEIVAVVAAAAALVSWKPHGTFQAAAVQAKAVTVAVKHAKPCADFGIR
jgi:hypothetical protein